MRFFIVFLSVIGILLFNGCYYQNACGISNSYWDEKGYYYDSQGNYHEVCPDNIIYKDEVLKQQQQEAVW